MVLAVLQGNVEQVFSIAIRVRRFWSYHFLYSVLPIVLCAWLGFIVFFLDKADLASRLQVPSGAGAGLPGAGMGSCRPCCLFLLTLWH